MPCPQQLARWGCHFFWGVYFLGCQFWGVIFCCRVGALVSGVDGLSWWSEWFLDLPELLLQYCCTVVAKHGLKYVDMVPERPDLSHETCCRAGGGRKLLSQLPMSTPDRAAFSLHTRLKLSRGSQWLETQPQMQRTTEPPQKMVEEPPSKMQRTTASLKARLCRVVQCCSRPPTYRQYSASEPSTDRQPSASLPRQPTTNFRKPAASRQPNSRPSACIAQPYIQAQYCDERFVQLCNALLQYEAKAKANVAAKCPLLRKSLLTRRWGFCYNRPSSAENRRRRLWWRIRRSQSCSV